MIGCSNLHTDSINFHLMWRLLRFYAHQREVGQTGGGREQKREVENKDKNQQASVYNAFPTLSWSSISESSNIYALKSFTSYSSNIGIS